MSALLDLTVLELGRAIRKGEVSPVEAVRAALAVAGDGCGGAFISLDAEEVVKRAKALENGAKKIENPLFGVPMALKDNICFTGLPTTCASEMLKNFRPPYDAYVVERLNNAGAICLGKTNMDEFGMGSTGETSVFGPVVNPWSPDRVAGGSSAGSAAAVSRGGCWYALGSDTGGSVRLPAAFCGLTGIKPTYGTVSRCGLVAYASSFDQIGPLSRDAADCAAVLDVIQGHDCRDSTSLPGAYGYLLAGLTGDIRGMRIGMPVQSFGDELDPEVRARVSEVADVLRNRGAVVEECELPALEYAVSAYYVMACAQAGSNLARYDGVRYGHRAPGCANPEELHMQSRTQGFGAEVKRRILLGTFVLSAGYYDDYYRKALMAREQIKQEFSRLLERYDLLLTPVAPGPAPRLGESLNDPKRMYLSDIYTVCANLTGLPALSMPCGFHSCGVPVGVQLTGPALGEDKVLNAAHAYQQETDWHRRRPECFGKGGTDRWSGRR
ncbi:MAG: Asp-tRNA(Asn)/Glu-tRNA(Gln) amidotransferase subunit GatA [Ruminococcaceae bacterium]|nr:Asp-tRNA(Asn)/Glu-tRNA(Gln) amidotransferase subunit GatA [Oscillospiraceae bacterium]